MIPINLIMSQLMNIGGEGVTTSLSAHQSEMERTVPTLSTMVPQAEDASDQKTGVEYHSDDGTGRLRGG